MADEPRSDEGKSPALTASIVAEAISPGSKGLRLWHLAALVLGAALMFSSRPIAACLISVGSCVACFQIVQAWVHRVLPLIDRFAAWVDYQARLPGWLAELLYIVLALMAYAGLLLAVILALVLGLGIAMILTYES